MTDPKFSYPLYEEFQASQPANTFELWPADQMREFVASDGYVYIEMPLRNESRGTSSEQPNLITWSRERLCPASEYAWPGGYRPYAPEGEREWIPRLERGMKVRMRDGIWILTRVFGPLIFRRRWKSRQMCP